jgi:hypothetical protein
LRLSLIVDRDVGKIAVGHQDRMCFLAAQNPGFDVDRDRGFSDPNQIGVDGNHVADDTGLRKFIASIATVTVRDFAILDAKIPPPISIQLSSQPPKMSPFWLVSAGIAIVRIDRSPQGSFSVFNGA